MQGLTLFNLNLTHLLDAFLETAVPMIAGLAEVVGLFIIITSLAKATFYYVRATFFNDHRDFHHEMSSCLTTALEFLMSAEIAKTFLPSFGEPDLSFSLAFAGRWPPSISQCSSILIKARSAKVAASGTTDSRFCSKNG